MKAVSPEIAAGGPFRTDAEFDAAAVRQAFERAGYTEDNLKALKRDLKSNHWVDVALLDRRTRAEATPFHCLARLFYLNRPVPAPELADALSPVDVKQLVEVGLIRAEPEGFRSVARIERHLERLVCSDFVSMSLDRPLASDHVLGVGPGAISLSALSPRTPVESVLDVCTGGGIQSLLAARHAERVVATDVCLRALNFAAFNLRLNGVHNVELRAGSFYAPVTGERFERIIANPPFVVSPASRFVYRDGGLGGDGVSEHAVRGAAEHLEEGGFAVLLLNWHHATKDDWAARPQAWTSENGCDVRWMRFDDEDPLSYAASWLRQEERHDEATAGRLLDEWMAYYASANIARIALGAAVMRKRSGGRTWTRCDDIPIHVKITACGDQMERIFAVEDLLAGLIDERELLDQRFKLHPAHRVDQSLIVNDGNWSVVSNILHVTEGMDFCANADVQTMRFLAEFNGTHTVREIAGPIAEQLERPFEEIVPICLSITKRLLRSGLLVRGGV